MDYQEFLRSKTRSDDCFGFEPLWMPDWLFGFQSFLDTWAIRKGRAAIIADCIAGETIISGPDGDERVDVLTTRKSPIRVWSMTPDQRIVISWASCPFVNGYAPLYRFTFTSGRSITATLGHRFLTTSGWKRGENLLIGERLAISDAIHQQTNLEYVPSMLHGDDQRWMQTTPDYLHHCLLYCYLCDEQPHKDLNNDQGHIPLQADALVHNRHYYSRDDLGNESVYNHRCLADVLPSIGHYVSQVVTIEVNEKSLLLSFGHKHIDGNIHTWLQSLEGTNFEKQVPEFHPSEVSRYGVCQCEPYKISWDTLSAIHYIRDDVFYDIEVPGNANYLANGVWSHNCGLGKSVLELVWGENIVRKDNRPVLLAAPLAVSHQMIREGEKFGIHCKQTQKGKVYKGINVTNYERLKYFNTNDFSGLILDEAGILKALDGKLRREITEFMLKVKYRLLATATPAPNDYMELGNHSEALGQMSRGKMLGMFFTNGGESTQQWELKGWAKKRFWRWMCSWARALRKPSDLGFSDEGFNLPPLVTKQHLVRSNIKRTGFGLVAAKTLGEQRAERRATIKERCEKVAELCQGRDYSIVWCHLNQEGNLLEKLIPGAVQVAGCDRDEVKEERLSAFQQGKIRVLVTKPKIGGWGLNLQHCAHMTMFPSHSFESAYQCIRRCYRFGQERQVNVDIVTSEGEAMVMANLQRKQKQAEELFAGLVEAMNEFQIGKVEEAKEEVRLPKWLK